MKLGLIQYSPAWENPEESVLKIEDLLKTTNTKFDLLVLPEMTLTGFTMNSEKFAEELDGIGTQYFLNLSTRLKTNIFAGIIERDGKNIYNSLVHFDSLGLIRARYRKIHPFSYAKEDQFYSAGNETVITQIDKIKFGLSVCYDLRFPELYRLYAKQQVDVLIDIANWPIPRIDHWKSLLKARAIENQCFMIGVNRVGTDPFNTYNGCSAVFDPMGNEIVLVGNEEKIIEAEIDLEKVGAARGKLPFLNDIKLI
ncbi:MAG: nitrilase-related carbon-nitrogen hydrolase [Melioribacteraceae bacterium]